MDASGSLLVRVLFGSSHGSLAGKVLLVPQSHPEHRASGLLDGLPEAAVFRSSYLQQVQACRAKHVSQVVLGLLLVRGHVCLDSLLLWR